MILFFKKALDNFEIDENSIDELKKKNDLNTNEELNSLILQLLHEPEEHDDEENYDYNNKNE